MSTHSCRDLSMQYAAQLQFRGSQRSKLSAVLRARGTMFFHIPFYIQ